MLSGNGEIISRLYRDGNGKLQLSALISEAFWRLSKKTPLANGHTPCNLKAIHLLFSLSAS